MLSPDQLDALADIAEAIDTHYTAQHRLGGLNGSTEDDDDCATADDIEPGNQADTFQSSGSFDSVC